MKNWYEKEDNKVTDIAVEILIKAYSGTGKFKWRNISVLFGLYSIAANENN